MPYGIGLAVQGMNQGLDQWRERNRNQAIQDEQLEMQRQQFDMQQRAADQQYGIRANTAEQQQVLFDQGQADRERDQMRMGILQAAQLGDWDNFANLSAQYNGYEVGMFDPETQRLSFGFQENDQFVPELATEFDQSNAHRIALHADPAAYFQEMDQEAAELKRITAETAAKAGQDASAHERRIQIEMIKNGQLVPEFTEDGLVLRAPTPEEAARGQNLTANQRDVMAIAQAQGVSEGVAWDIFLSRSMNEEQYVERIGTALMRDSREFRNDPEGAYKKAREIFDSVVKRQGSRGRQTQAPDATGYGISQPAQPDPMTEPNGSRNRPIPLNSVSGPAELIVGHFYVDNDGKLMQWNGQELVD